MPRMRVLELVHEEEQHGRIVKVRNAYQDNQPVFVNWRGRWQPGVVVEIGRERIGRSHVKVDFEVNSQGDRLVRSLPGDRVRPRPWTDELEATMRDYEQRQRKGKGTR